MACVRRFLVQCQSNPCVAMSDSGKYKSITQRYPGIKGKLLRDKVDSDYVSETNRTLRFLDSNGKQLLRAHDLNERNQGVVIEEYVAGILEHGLIADVRSKPICIRSESQYDDESFMLVGHWQLCSAIYEAHRREPHNKQVMATIRDGLKGALVLKKHTPEDVIIYYRDQANMFHKGSGISFVQLLRDVKNAEAAWKDYRSEHNISVASCRSTGPSAYEHQYWEFIEATFPNKWPHWKCFDSCKAARHLMDSVLGPKSLHELETVMGNSCDFRNCRTASIMQTVHKIILTLKFFQDKVNKATLTFFVQALLFGVPVKKLGGPRNCDVPFLLEDHGEAFLSRFKTGMAQSPIYKPQDKDTADAEKVISLNLKRATLVQKTGTERQGTGEGISISLTQNRSLQFSATTHKWPGSDVA